MRWRCILVAERIVGQPGIHAVTLRWLMGAVGCMEGSHQAHLEVTGTATIDTAEGQ